MELLSDFFGYLWFNRTTLVYVLSILLITAGMTKIVFRILNRRVWDRQKSSNASPVFPGKIHLQSEDGNFDLTLLLVNNNLYMITYKRRQ